jgi:hypothetical protein
VEGNPVNFAIVVENGSANKKIIALSQEVARVGGNQRATIVVPGLPDWALTVFEIDGQHYVLNRNCAQMTLNGRAVRRGERVAWRVDERVEVSSELALRLVMRGMSAGAAAVPPETPDDEEEKRQSEHRMRRLTEIVSALAILLAGGLFWPSGAPDLTTIQEAYEARIADLQNLRTPDSRRYRRATLLLQRGWAAELWNDPAEAAGWYEQLRAHLAQQSDEPADRAVAAWTRQVEESLQRFVVHRMTELDS